MFLFSAELSLLQDLRLICSQQSRSRCQCPTGSKPCFVNPGWDDDDATGSISHDLVHYIYHEGKGGIYPQKFVSPKLVKRVCIFIPKTLKTAVVFTGKCVYGGSLSLPLAQSVSPVVYNRVLFTSPSWHLSMGGDVWGEQ